MSRAELCPPSDDRSATAGRPGAAAPAADAGGRLAADSALRSIVAHVLLWSVTAAGLLVDLSSKDWAFHVLGPNETRTLVPGIITAHRSLNSGALFGALSGWVWVFIIASVLALAFVVYVFACSGRRQRFLHVVLGLILAGALGNLYDRIFVEADVLTLHATADAPSTQDIGIVTSDPNADPLVLACYPDKTLHRRYPRQDVLAINRHGVVRDFVKFSPIRGFDYWPWVFNLADAMLVAGVGGLIVTFWRERRAAERIVAQPTV